MIQYIRLVYHNLNSIINKGRKHSSKKVDNTFRVIKKKAYCENVRSKQNETAWNVFENGREKFYSLLLPTSDLQLSYTELKRYLFSQFPILSYAAVILNPS